MVVRHCLLPFFFHPQHFLPRFFLGLCKPNNDCTRPVDRNNITNRTPASHDTHDMMNPLTRIALICLCLDVVRAQGAASGPSPVATTASNEEVNKLALWPDVDIRGLLAGEPNATGNAPNPIDLLFVLQAGSVTLVPANDGGLIGGQVLLRKVLAQIVVFADRPYRTMDMLSLEDFFAFELVQDFFAGPNPPNAIITGELPQDIRLQRHNESDSMPYRRLLGTVLGAAEWDSQQPSELRFDIPAGMDIFRENGRVDIVDDELFQDLRKGYANASYDGFPTLHRVTVFIDPFQTAPEETQLNIGRRLLQRGRVGRRGGRYGRAGAFAAPRGFGRRWNGNINNYWGGRNAFLGGFSRGGLYGSRLVGMSTLYPGWGGFGCYDDGFYDPSMFSGRAMTYQTPNTVVQQVPVYVPVPAGPAPPVPTQTSVMTKAILKSELTGTWAGDGGGAGMGSIRVSAVETVDGLEVTAQLPGCETCKLGCRWERAIGTAMISSDGGSQLQVDFVSCDARNTITTLRGILAIAANGRNVIYWSPATHSTQWIRNS